MDKSIPEPDAAISRLRILKESDEGRCNRTTFDLQEYRKRSLERAEAEQFWAGRRIAQRNSTRRAA